PELQTVITANRLHWPRALSAERRGSQIVVAVRVGNNYRPVQHISKSRSRVADVEAKVVGDRHILDRVVEALARVTSLQPPLVGDGPIHTRHKLMLRDGLHVRLNRRITRIRLRGTEIHVFNEATGNPRRLPRRRTAGL